MRKCVAAFVAKEGKVLLGMRSERRSFYPNIWDVFGGHVEPNESRKDALRRELQEELGITPTQSRFLLTIDEPDPDKYGSGQYHIYLVTNWVGEPQNLQPEEHAGIEWFAIEQAVNLQFTHPLYSELILEFGGASGIE